VRTELYLDLLCLACADLQLYRAHAEEILLQVGELVANVESKGDRELGYIGDAHSADELPSYADDPEVQVGVLALFQLQLERHADSRDLDLDVVESVDIEADRLLILLGLAGREDDGYPEDVELALDGDAPLVLDLLNLQREDNLPGREINV